jgi:hypothetical protein
MAAPRYRCYGAFMNATFPIIVRNSASNRFNLPHQPPATWLGELVKCFCGHGIGKHSSSSCEGDIRGRCNCCLSPNAVLEAATRAERE